MAELFWDKITGLLGLNNQNKKPTGVMDYASEDPEAISWGNLQPVQRSVPEYARNLGETWANMGEGSLLALRGAVADVPAAVAGAYTAFGPEAGLRRPGEGRMEAFGRGFTEAKQSQPIGLLREGYEELSAQTQPFSFGDMSQQDRMMAREMGAPLGLAEAAAIPTAARAVRGAANMAAEAVERSPLGQGILGLQEQRGLPSMAVQDVYMGVRPGARPDLPDPRQRIVTNAGEGARAQTGAWVTKSEGQAHTYSPTGDVVPIQIEDRGFATVDYAPDSTWMLAREGTKMTLPDGKKIDVSGQSTNDIARYAREQGIPGVQFKGLLDVGGSGKNTPEIQGLVAEYKRGGPVDQYVVIDENRIWPKGQPQPQGLLGRMSETGFYSPLERAVGDLTQQKGTGDQMLAMIQKQAGVKPEEVQWTGLGDFLAGKPSVTKSEIEDYLLNNRVELKEVQLGIGPWDASKEARLKQLNDEYAALQDHPIDAPEFGEEKYDEFISLMNSRDNLTTEQLYANADEAMREGQILQRQGDRAGAERWFRSSELFNARAEFQELRGGGAGMPKFSQYTTPGGSNYRELLMTMPYKYDAWIAKKAEADAAGREAMNLFQARGTNDPLTQAAMDKEKALWDEANSMRPPAQYESSHYDQPNILAHTRVKDYEQDGQKILHVDEVQSDWHQAGRKQGYATKESEAEYKTYFDDLKSRFNKAVMDDHISSGTSAERAKELADTLTNKLSANPVKMAEYFGEEGKMRALLDARIDAKNAVPDAPFKKNWHELMTRRILQEAADKGYSRVTFTTGRTQAERYDLSKQVDSISWADAGSSKSLTLKGVKGASGKDIEIYLDKDTNKVKFTDFGAPSEWEGKDLADIVGKEVAEKVANSADGSLSGDGLAVGGEGMKGFYDNMMVKAFNKEGKKFGVKVEPFELRTGLGSKKPDDMSNAELLHALDAKDPNKEQVWSMEIPPEMRAKKKAEGSPMFSAAPAIPGTGLLAGQEDTEQNQPEYNGVLGM